LTTWVIYFRPLGDVNEKKSAGSDRSDERRIRDRGFLRTHFRQFHRHFKKPLSHNQRLTLEKADFACKCSLQNGVLYEYLQIAESFRKDGKPRQRVLATLGRRDRLEADGTIDSLVESLAKFSQKFRVLKTRTTSVSIYRDTETEWRKRGYSRDHRPDLPQLVLGVAVDRKGWPVSWEVFPGNTADPEAFEAMIAKMRTRFRIGRVVVVADRGMMEKKSLDPLTTGKTPHD
jgi:hypothetical protein